VRVQVPPRQSGAAPSANDPETLALLFPGVATAGTRESGCPGMAIHPG